MLEGVSLDEKIKFVSKFDKTEPKTEFYFRPLSGAEMFELKSDDTSLVIRMLNQSIVEIVNIPNNMDKLKYLRSLKTNVLNELFDKFNQINNISDDEEKN